MTHVYFISDLHIGHKNILKYREHSSIEEHDSLIKDNWCSRVGKRDIVWVLGDSAFTKEGLEFIGTFPGRKKLVRGNHEDRLSTQDLLEVFETVEGLVRYKNFWLSHAPIHPQELRGRKNIHGHVHRKSVIDIESSLCTYHPQAPLDTRYINVCVEMLDYTPRTLEELLWNNERN